MGGFYWQFITLAGFHMDSLGISQFARAYKTDGMKAYVTMIQRQERNLDVETLSSEMVRCRDCRRLLEHRHSWQSLYRDHERRRHRRTVQVNETCYVCPRSFCRLWPQIVLSCTTLSLVQV